MKLSAYIALLESIRKSNGGDLDVFIAEGSGGSGRGLAGTREPTAPVVVTLLKQGGRDDVEFVNDASKFRGDFTRTYKEVGKAVRLV
jgi:hypothetical protein